MCVCGRGGYKEVIHVCVEVGPSTICVWGGDKELIHVCEGSRI